MAGSSELDISKELGRTVYAVRTRIYKLGLSLRSPA
jgi:hypothetical protein